MNQLTFNGLVAATHSPFHADGALNLAAVERQVEYLSRQQVPAVFVCGTTGEFHSLTLAERRLLAQRWLEVTRGSSIQVIVHVGSNCLADARELAAQAEKLGARAIAALAPSYFRPRTLTDLVRWCSEIASAAPATPFYYYNIPSMTGVSFPMPLFLEQASELIPTLNGMKFTNQDLISYQECLAVQGGAFDLPWGVDEALLAALTVGARGGIGSSFNFAAPIYHRLLAAFARGDLAAARQEQGRSVQLMGLLAEYGSLGAAKAVMGMLGVDVGPARLPNVNPTRDQLQPLRAGLDRIGFFEWIGSPTTRPTG